MNQIIIVEGKSDTQKLKKIFGERIQTIETKGLSLNKNTIKSIKNLSENNEIIIFTDPDGPGKKIREKLVNELNKNTLHAFIDKNDFEKDQRKIGVAEAKEEQIKKALQKIVKTNNNLNSITWKEYTENNFYLKSNRIEIQKSLNLNLNLSSKSLFKWINWMGLSKNDLFRLVKEKNGNKS